jgi:hypothetical protein
VEKKVALCFVKKNAFRVPCERIIYRIVGRKNFEREVQNWTKIKQET